MKFGLIRTLNPFTTLVYQLAIRMYDIFPKKHGPMGLGFFCFSIIVNLMCIFTFIVNHGIVDKKYEVCLNVIAISSGVFAISITAFFYIKKDFYSLLHKEKLKGKQFNQGWVIFTWIYMILTIVLAIFILN